MLESKFQKNLIKELEDIFPGCIILKNDANYIQGIPDLLILFKDKWAALELKKESGAHHQNNQDWYIEKMNDMSFASFICPETKEEVLNELQRAFKPPRSLLLFVQKQKRRF